MNTEQESCGLFGKIPQQSDFVNLHLPESFIEHWHHWAQSCVSISREQLGDDWLDRYITSPIWHFAIMPGVAHEKSIVGIMIPSVDEVGRYFPFTIAHTGEHDVWGAYLNGDPWFEQAEKLALLPLAEDITYSRIVSNLIEPCLAISAGLPDPGQFAAMLDGQWQQWGWSQEQVQTETS